MFWMGLVLFGVGWVLKQWYFAYHRADPFTGIPVLSPLAPPVMHGCGFYFTCWFLEIVGVVLIVIGGIRACSA